MNYYKKLSRWTKRYILLSNPAFTWFPLDADNEEPFAKVMEQAIAKAARKLVKGPYKADTLPCAQPGQRSLLTFLQDLWMGLSLTQLLWMLLSGAAALLMYELSIIPGPEIWIDVILRWITYLIVSALGLISTLVFISMLLVPFRLLYAYMKNGNVGDSPSA